MGAGQGGLRRLKHRVGSKTALGLLPADVDLKENGLDDAELFGLPVDILKQLIGADGFDERDLADDLLHLVALEMTDEVQRRAVVGVLRELLRHLLHAVLAERVDARGDGLAAGRGVVHLARADKRDVLGPAPGGERRGGNVFPYLLNVFPNAHVHSTTFPSYRSFAETIASSPARSV